MKKVEQKNEFANLNDNWSKNMLLDIYPRFIEYKKRRKTTETSHGIVSNDWTEYDRKIR